MTGPAEAVFDGVVAPSPSSAPVESGSAPRVDAGIAAIDCATACVNGCLRPEACPSAEARARVTALLEGRSLDDLVALAGESLESRTRGRLSRDAPAP